MNVAAVDVAPNLQLTLDRIESDDSPVYELTIGAPDGCDGFPMIDPADIPAMIDAPTGLYRTYHANLYRDACGA
ncbi:hypothetical protein TVH25_19455 [Rhodococcus sp. 7Tela_A2]|uniref:hypothetical protein n=1 Tax=Rhodococcus sp. 7Tela_A2 TaxID=3093744 RepID=UPI003BB51616